MTLRAVHKTIAGRDIDTIINGLPAQPADEKPTTYSK
jgi:hypothetical protein